MSTSDTAFRNSLRRDLRANGYGAKRTLQNLDPKDCDWLTVHRPANAHQNDATVESYREIDQATACLHAIEYDDGTVKTHVDRYHPNPYPVKHAVYDVIADTALYLFIAGLLYKNVL